MCFRQRTKITNSGHAHKHHYLIFEDMPYIPVVRNYSVFSSHKADRLFISFVSVIFLCTFLLGMLFQYQMCVILGSLRIKQFVCVLDTRFVCDILCTFLLGMLFSSGRVFFLALSARGKQGVRWYVTTHVWIPAELSGACSEHLKSLSWLFCQEVAFRLAEPSRAMANPTFCLLFLNSQFRSHTFVYPLRPPACYTTLSVHLYPPSLLSATIKAATAAAPLCDSHGK